MIFKKSLLPLLVCVVGAASGCTKAGQFRTDHAESVKMDELPADFKIPAKIWEIIEKTGTEKPGESASNSGIFYSEVKLYLTEKNTDVLKSPAYVIELPRGGGTIDLSQYLTGNQGSFYVGFELPAEFQEGTNFKAIYVSQARKRRLDNRVYGAGCNQFFEITPKFTEMMKTEGIKANTTRQRHVTLLAGHYIFSVMKENRIYLTQVTLTDSADKNLLCEAL